jgi:2-polyprenyl-3-methyl-5-hydroxy-6-metoxy-1,4-benzoquinol methylase
MKSVTKGEYKIRGDYHKKLDKNWSYYPTYLAKKRFIFNFLFRKPIDSKILDIGCGEGVFINELISHGFKKVEGIDLNYSSKLVRKGDILMANFPSKSFDFILLLDVIEHLNFLEQSKILKEIYRILKDNGELVISIPNLAHFYSRLTFLLKGKLSRTARIDKHPGDRPIKEYIDILKESGFKIIKRKGFFPTYPILYNIIILFPSKSIWLYNFLNKIIAYPNFCFLNIFVVKKYEM